MAVRDKRNYVMSPHNDWINGEWQGDFFCCDTGQCTKLECSEWIDGLPHYPELERDDRGFALCPKCGASYGADALTGSQYRKLVSDP